MRILLLLLALCGLPAFADQTPPISDLTSTLAAAEQMPTRQTEIGGDIFEALADHLLAKPKLTLPCFTFTLLMMVIIVALYRFGCSKTIIAAISLVTMCMWSFVLREDAIMRQIGNISFSLLIFMPLLSCLRNIFVNGRIIIASISDVVKGKKKKNPSRAGKKSHASSPTSDLIEQSKSRKKIAGVVLFIVVALIILALYLDTEWLANAASRFVEFIIAVLAIVVIVLGGGFKSGGGGGSSSGGSFRGGGGSSGGGGASGRW